jgi:acyl carrier protein
MINKINKIINTIIENKGGHKLSDNMLSSNTHLRNDIGFDSLDMAELTVRIEAEFKIDIFENNIVYTIQEILDILHK